MQLTLAEVTGEEMRQCMITSDLREAAVQGRGNSHWAEQICGEINLAPEQGIDLFADDGNNKHVIPHAEY